MHRPDIDKASAAVKAWIGDSDCFAEGDPWHALRCAAHALHDAGVLPPDAHDAICWEQLS